VSHSRGLRPRFVPTGECAPPGALAVDGPVAGAVATYSHWQGLHTTPPELVADTSTGMLVRAAADPERWLAPFTTACNHHVDADGLLSLLAACRPELALAHGARLIAAATTGDFTCWTGPAAYDLVLRLHQLIRDHQVSGPGWEQRCLEATIAQADQLLTGEWPGARERQQAIAQVEAAIAALPRPTITGVLATVRWPRRCGHASDGFLAVYQPDDLPLLALSTAIPPTCFQLLIEETPAGSVVCLDAPRHSWAHTVDLPLIRWPDLNTLARDLAAGDPGVPWTARPGAEAVGFTCLIASRGPSRLDPDEISARCATALTESFPPALPA
jgi:hypothetical protein